ncbi:glycosyltransferase [Desulfonatronum thiodismutans]|uniref:glycosyltransferase n=1 Tax=Desulfonatronum thiodismutans TaxID=159290 RepID=UPI000A0586DA|nr:glycosyltransferase [Desulfonatronum thiodismutans]
MRSVVLIPYCPLPINTGAKAEMWKHLNILHGLGPCTIASARRRPVGLGWTPRYEQEIRNRGFDLVFREDCIRLGLLQVYGFFYGLFCKGLGLDRAFGHSNPYHRHAFPAGWLHELSTQFDLAVINYSHWGHLPCACPKVVVLHDLVSDVSWEGAKRETIDLGSADLLVVISLDEEKALNQRGIFKTLWSPPSVDATEIPLNSTVGLVGSGSLFNIEGLHWLERALGRDGTANIPIRVYGGLANHVRSKAFAPVGCYEDPMQPYMDCGVVLMPTAEGTGVQIKAVEALAAGRAIIARKGAMRGLPPGEGAWIEVDSPRDMVLAALRLQADQSSREALASKARSYYEQWLDSAQIKASLKKVYTRLGMGIVPRR